MKAVGFKTSYPIEHPDSLVAFDTSKPEAHEHDLVVKVSAVSVNPADAKIRVRAAKDTALAHPRIVGYDAVGIVDAVGPKAQGFAVGDRVYYAGDVVRSGSNAEFQAVDARVVAKAPRMLSDAQAATLPLTALTGWEALFDRLRIAPAEKGRTLLIIGGAGGVGSITIQIAKQMTKLTVIATASRPETVAWVREMGADHLADHRNLEASVKALGFETVDTVGHWDAMCELIAPQGLICGIVEFDGGVKLAKLQGKSAGFIWELMFTRPLFDTKDISRQHDILAQLTDLVDAGRIKPTLTATLSGLSAETIKEAHRRIESATTIGKIAITY